MDDGIEKGGNIGILLSTHVLATAEQICDRFVLLPGRTHRSSGNHGKDVGKEAGMPQASLDELFIHAAGGSQP